MEKWKQLVKWLPVPLLCLCGGFIYFFVAGCRFLGLVVLGLAGLYALHLVLWLLRKHHKKAGTILLAVFYTLGCIGITACVWVGVLVGNASKGSPDTPCQYMIVLGAGINGSTPSRSLQDRIDAAYAYLTEHPQVQCIVSGGQGPGENLTEAQCMYDHLTAMGIDGSRIWLEDRSTSTLENIEFSLNVVEEKTGSRPDTAGILSSEYHLYRAGLFAKQQGLTAVGIPARTYWRHLFVSYFVREIFAVLYYSILG